MQPSCHDPTDDTAASAASSDSTGPIQTSAGTQWNIGAVHSARDTILTNQVILNSTYHPQSPPLTALDLSIVGILKQDNQQPVSVIPTLHQLRPPVRDFVGRVEEISAIVIGLSPTIGQETALLGGIFGMGGVGKTELAYAAAARLRFAYPDAQLVLEMRGIGAEPLTPQAALQTVIRAFVPLTQPSEDLPSLQSLYRSLLDGKRVLIVVDNAHNATQVQPLLPPPGCALLITSRHHFSLPGMSHYTLNTLSLHEAQALLLAICPRIGDGAARLAQLCGGLPLALRVSASLLANDASRQLNSYIVALSDERSRLSKLRDPEDATLDVNTSLSLSYAALTKIEQKTLCQLGVFSAPFDLGAAATVLGLASVSIRDSKQMHLRLMDRLLELSRLFRSTHQIASPDELLGKLYRYSLLQFDTTTERFSLHDLVRLFVSKQSANQRIAHLRHARYYLQVARHISILYAEGGERAFAGLATLDLERRHIDAAWTWLQEQPSSAKIDKLAMGYAGTMGKAFYLRSSIGDEWIPRLEYALQAARRRWAFGTVNVIYHNLGLAYERRHDWQRAIEYYQLALATHLFSEDGANPTLNNLGNIYKRLGKTHQAIAYYEQALKLHRGTTNYQAKDSSALGNLGVCYLALGDVKRAIEFSEQQITIAHEMGDWHEEGIGLSNLASGYLKQGETERAIECYKQALAIFQQLGDQSGEAHQYGDLGDVYQMLGSTKQAAEHYEQQLAIARAIGDPYQEVLALRHLGRTYTKSAEPVKAIEYYNQQLTVARTINDQHELCDALSDLGRTYNILGESQRALMYHQESLKISHAIGDPQRESADLLNIGGLYAEIGELDKAIKHFEQALEINRAISDQWGEAAALGNLGLAHATLGDIERAIDCHEQNLSIARASGNVESASAALRNLGAAYAELGNLPRAIDYYQESLSITRATGDQRGEAISSWNLGTVFVEQGDLERAVELMQILVNFETAIGHQDATQHSAVVQELHTKLQKLKEGSDLHSSSSS